MLILDLCGGTGAWSHPYREAGYCVDVIDLPRDVRLLQRVRAGVHGILAAPPCTVFSYARNRYEPTEAEYRAALSVVDACLRIVTVQQPRWWALENPRNKLRRLSRASAVGVLSVGIWRRGTQADVYLGELRAAAEAAETSDEAKHVSDPA